MKIKGYKFKSGARLPAKKATAVAKRLKQISGKSSILTPEAVVSDARHRNSPLHALFEWNDGKAAAKYRLEQARHLIRHVIVVYEDSGPERKPRECRAYYTVEPTSTGGPYIALGRILSEKELRESLVAEALREAISWQARYKHLAELAGIVLAIDKAVAKVAKKKRRAKPAKKGKKVTRRKTKAA